MAQFGGTLTLDGLKSAMREFEESRMDAEMDILLSDNGPAKLMLLHGGTLIECNGDLFVVSREFSDPFGTLPPRLDRS